MFKSSFSRREHSHKKNCMMHINSIRAIIFANESNQLSWELVGMRVNDNFSEYLKIKKFWFRLNQCKFLAAINGVLECFNTIAGIVSDDFRLHLSIKHWNWVKCKYQSNKIAAASYANWRKYCHDMNLACRKKYHKLITKLRFYDFM